MIGARLPAWTRYAVRKVDNTLAELTSLKGRVSDRRSDLLADGVDVVSASVDVKKNRVEVGIRNKTNSRTDAVKAIGDPIVVVDQKIARSDACMIDDCPNLKGGLLITQGNTKCTSGYIALRWDTDEYVMVTAGHCIADAVSSGDYWKHPGTGPNAFGAENSQHGWQNDSLADVGIIRIWENFIPPNKNKFLSGPGSGTQASITGYLTFSQQIVDMQVCRIGWGSWANGPNDHYKARKCGKIKLYDSDSDGTGNPNSQSCAPNQQGQTICRYIRDMKVVDFDSWGGDSGGIVFEPNNPVDAPTNLLGTHVHSQDGVFPDANRSWYSTTTKGFSELQSRGINIRPCQTAGC